MDAGGRATHGGVAENEVKPNIIPLEMAHTLRSGVIFNSVTQKIKAIMHILKLLGLTLF